MALLIAGVITCAPLAQPDTASPEARTVVSPPDTPAAASTAPLPSPATSGSGRSRRGASAGPGAPGASSPDRRKTPAADTSTKAATTDGATSGSVFQGVGPKTCLHAPSGGGQVETVACDDTDTGQLFSLAPDRTLRARGKCAQVEGTSNGSLVTMVTCTGGRAQQWTYNASLELVAASEGNCLDIPYAKDAEGLAMWVWVCVGADNQRWRHRN